MTQALRSLGRTVEGWLVAPEPRAAGCMGLYRILYALFYLWHLSDYTVANLHELPRELHFPLLINAWLPHPLPVAFLESLAALLVGSLLLLLLGYRTRTSTAAVLVLGALLESLFASVNYQRSTVFLTAFIPGFMLIGGDWGATYSIDSLRRRLAGEPRIDPADSSPRFVLPAHAVLAVLAVLFLSAGVYKALSSSPWLSAEESFAHVMMKARIKAAALGLPQNPAVQLFVDIPWLDWAMRRFVVLFEGCFVLALLHRGLRSAYLALALCFHSINAIWMAVTFTPILIVYGLFVDWERLLRRFWKDRSPLPQVPGWSLSAAAIGFAVAGALLWYGTDLLHRLVTLGGILTWHTIWYPVLPIALVSFARYTLKLIQFSR